ncbi:MAG: hypothetical protein HC903_25400 [Methylacidiphilales bacterium]|nr:hypothetical protein [Candidatus Methylacidiphilales bacterium]
MVIFTNFAINLRFDGAIALLAYVRIGQITPSQKAFCAFKVSSLAILKLTNWNLQIGICG